MLENLKSRTQALKREALTVYFAAKDPRTPWYAKALTFLVVAHTLSPIDLIPDFIPIIGYLDDLVITPLGLALAIRSIPADVLEEARRKAAGSGLEGTVGYVGAVVIVLVWIVLLIFILRLIKFLS